MSRRTINNNVRLSQSDHQALKSLAEKSDVTIAEYLRKLVKADIAHNSKERKKYDTSLERDVAIVMATIYLIAEGREQEDKKEILDHADQLEEKVSDYMNRK